MIAAEAMPGKATGTIIHSSAFTGEAPRSA